MKKLSDIASALGLSETTVSRVLSGKGRISQATRERVLTFIQTSGYKPNMIAKGLAQQKTFNLCALIPKDAVALHLPFFQNCLMGISEEACKRDYDVIVALVSREDRSQAERILAAEKADGFVLLRAVKDDPTVALLKEAAVPFVLIGSSEDKSLVSVDADNEAASREVTLRMLRAGSCRPALLLGDMAHTVNLSRKSGFLAATAPVLLQAAPVILENLTSDVLVRQAVRNVLRASADALICGDDFICAHVLRALRQENLSVPVASLYNSELLSLLGSVTAAETIDAFALGEQAAQKLIALVERNP